MKTIYVCCQKKLQRWGASLCAALVCSMVPNAHAALKENVIRLRAQVSNMYGKAIEQEFAVTVFEDDAPYKGLKSIAIVMHGRAADPVKRAAMGRATYKANAQWLAEQGFVVAVPTRIGYGVSGGEDAEDSGHCSGKNYPPPHTRPQQTKPWRCSATCNNALMSTSTVLLSLGNRLAVQQPSPLLQ